MSPLLDKTSPSGKCFTFYYHMYGSGIGTLQIYINNARTTAGKKQVWSLSGNKGNKWHNGKVNLRTANRTYQVIVLFFAVKIGTLSIFSNEQGGGRGHSNFIQEVRYQRKEILKVNVKEEVLSAKVDY